MTKDNCCQEPKNHKYKCPYCRMESNNARELSKHQPIKHPGHIHFLIVKAFTKMGRTR